MKSLRVLSIASEIFPLIKIGELADVTGALPIALKSEGIEVRTVVPGYPSVMNSLGLVEGVIHLPNFFGAEARLIRATSCELGLFVLDAPHLFSRAGNPYLRADGEDWPDNAMRFAALARIAADIGLGFVSSFVPDIVHAHDWHGALALAYMHYSDRQRPATVMTVHNLAYQGVFPREMLAAIDLPPQSFAVHGVEYYGRIGFLKAGLYFADRITTVSPTYAREILSDEGGMGLGGLLRERSCDLSGILNGIDTSVWDPATDPHIPGCFYTDVSSGFESEVLQNRATNKAALQRRLGLQLAPDVLMLGVIGRLSSKEGLDLLLENLPTIVREGMQLVVLGSGGDRSLQYRYRAAAQAHPERVSVTIGHDEGLAHLIQAGADALVVPSRFEPCGLTQLCALRYGTVPIVSRIGGLEDTVVDADDLAITGGGQTGFKFGPVTAENLAGVLQRACATFHDVAAWRRIQRNGMSIDVSWRNPASRYADLYSSLVEVPQEKVA
ncbi:MAG TPA: glycogen synthase GlgA [Bradyrhizobium sp.]|nr:glycogen synthase GlgA [Bradyrhizobium sp.]